MNETTARPSWRARQRRYLLQLRSNATSISSRSPGKPRSARAFIGHAHASARPRLPRHCGRSTPTPHIVRNLEARLPYRNHSVQGPSPLTTANMRMIVYSSFLTDQSNRRRGGADLLDGSPAMDGQHDDTEKRAMGRREIYASVPSRGVHYYLSKGSSHGTTCRVLESHVGNNVSPEA